ncbi:MAG: ATP-binding protein [Gemmataceae bacterium]
MIDADPDQLRQLLFNLIINALEASAHDSVVEVALTSQDYSIELRVLDRGVGLPDELGDQIYEPFVSSKDSGLGLGLSICRRIVEDHGGTLQAANRPGGGAVFAVQLPILSRNDQGLP